MTNMERTAIEQQAIRRYGAPAQVDMLIEEMSELTKALLKLRRSAARKSELVADIIEEMADVQIMLDQGRMMFGETEEKENEKLERLKVKLSL